jgi:hypothetical protein
MLREMPKIASRQFTWQRGWFNYPQFFRSAYIYAQGASSAYFLERYGLSIDQFSLIGFALHTHFLEVPVAGQRFDISSVGISGEVFERALPLLSLSLSRARSIAHETGKPLMPIAYQQSLLRRFPCVMFGEGPYRLRAPLPQLILERVTSGIFYDLADAGWAARQEYGRRFEAYCLELTQAMLPKLTWLSETDYAYRKQARRTPDILVSSADSVVVAIECKATRMSFDARYSDDPLQVRGYDDLIKAVFQLWRFFSHSRCGKTGFNVSETAVGLILTLDSWLVMANDLTSEIVEAAHRMADEKGEGILEVDRKPVFFCSITDLETTCSKATEDSFLEAVRTAAEEKRFGWLLSSIHEEIGSTLEDRKGYPFHGRLGDVLPWWSKIEEENAAQQG